MNILFVPHNKKEIRPAYVSKYNHKCKNQGILLMITDDGKRWHYLVARSLSALLRGISSSNNGDFYCLNCFHSYRTHNKLKMRERVCNNHDYCLLKYRSQDKSLKDLNHYADLECLLKKKKTRQNNLENSCAERKVAHKPSGYPLSLNCSFDETKKRRKFYRRKDKVRDHCHNTGKFRVAANSDCNLKYKVP